MPEVAPAAPTRDADTSTRPRPQQQRVRIGLIRHFEVCHPMPAGWMEASGITRWLEAYNAAEIIPCPVDLGGIDWKRCFSSDLERARRTAEALFAGEIRLLAELREPDIGEFATGRLKLPFTAWRWLLRAAWMLSHPSQRPARDDFLARVRFIADEIVAKAEEDTLIVSHAGMMAYLRKELLRRGFDGPRFGMARNGALYVFEKPDVARPPVFSER